jgi:tight adherence protein B
MYELVGIGTLGVLEAVAVGLLLRELTRRREWRLRVEERLLDLAEQRVRAPSLTPGKRSRSNRMTRALSSRLLRAGIAPSPRLLWSAAAVSLLAMGIGGSRLGGLGAVAGALVVLASAWILVLVRTSQHLGQMRSQLPAFLAHVLRAVSSGSSVALALDSATRETAQPLRGVFERVQRKAQRGADLEQALGETTRAIGLRELSMLALTIRVNQRFGGSIRALLESLQQTLRTRERAQRELEALTAETRLSAWVLGLLPLAIVIYVLLMNPDYLTRMWEDRQGRMLLTGAGALQVLGSLLLWRMVRSV